MSNPILFKVENKNEYGLQCFASHTPVETNGGYTSLGDGQGNKKIYLTKNGVTMILDESDIIHMRNVLSFFDPRLL